PHDLEFQAEMEEHVRLLAARYRLQGMAADAAMLAARRQFGNTTLLQEDLRAMQMIPAIEALRGDLRYAARLLRRNPGFAAVAVRASSFASSFILGGQSEASRLAGGDVSWNFFSVLGVRFMLGRNFLPDEDLPGHDRVAILSYAAWSERFGADRDIAGKAITLDDQSYTVVGVLPAGFQFGSTAEEFQARGQADIWVPLALDPQKLQRGAHMLHVIARLKPGVKLAQGQAELDVLAANLAQQYPKNNKDIGIVAVPLTDQVTESVRVALETLLGAVGLVLLIACANVANLLLGRSAA